MIRGTKGVFREKRKLQKKQGAEATLFKKFLGTGTELSFLAVYTLFSVFVFFFVSFCPKSLELEYQLRGCFYFQKLPQSLAPSPQGRKGKKILPPTLSFLRGQESMERENPFFKNKGLKPPC